MQTRDGGKPNVKSMPYSQPKGPTNQMKQGPGLGGDNLGQCGTQGTHHTASSESGRPGIGGSNAGNKGSQR